MQGLGVRVKRVYGLGSRVQGLGFRVQSRVLSIQGQMYSVKVVGLQVLGVWG